MTMEDQEVMYFRQLALLCSEPTEGFLRLGVKDEDHKRGSPGISPNVPEEVREGYSFLASQRWKNVIFVTVTLWGPGEHKGCNLGQSNPRG